MFFFDSNTTVFHKITLHPIFLLYKLSVWKIPKQDLSFVD